MTPPRFLSSMVALAALGLLAGAGNAHAACLGATPVAAASAFYRHHYTFWNDPLPTLEQDTTARLLRLLKRDRACADVGEICAINADPWLDAQDGEARDPRFVAEGKNVVQVRYRFVLGGGQPSQPQVARVRLAREGGCWRVDDLVGPNGASLREALASYHYDPGAD
jgi:hypothetical protein